MPTARGGAAAAVIDAKIYIAGGRPARGGDFAVFDPVENQWTPLPGLPTQRNHLAAAAADEKVYVDHNVYDPFTNTWASLAPLPIAIHGVTGLALLHGLIYLPGGGTAQGGSRGGTQHQVYRPRLSC